MSILLETKRLIIKNPTIFDLEKIIEMESDPDIMQFIGGSRTIDKAKKWFEKSVSHHQKHGFSFGLVYEKDTGAFVGRAGIMYLEYDDMQSDIEVGYRLLRSAWNKGYATELTRALIDWGFHNLSVSKLVAIVHPDNKNSQRVLEKSGMKYVCEDEYCGVKGKRYEIQKSRF